MSDAWQVTITDPLGIRSTGVYHSPEEVNHVIRDAYENGCDVIVRPLSNGEEEVVL